MMQTLKNSMIMVVESLINKFEEDQMRKEEMHREKQHSQSNSQYTDNCSDSDSSFNQVRETDDFTATRDIFNILPFSEYCW